MTTASWAPDGESFVTGSLGRQSQLCLWNLHGRSVYSWATNYRIQDCEISPDGQRLVTISPNQQIFVYNFVTREEEHSINLKSKMTCISISRDSRYMLINMTDNEIQLVDIETAQIVQRYEGQKQGGFVIRSAFGGADENLVISGSEGKPSISHQPFSHNSFPPFYRFQSLHMAKGEWHAHRGSLGPQRRVCQRSVMESGRSMHVRFCRR